ncbi:MAG: MmcQ/YjbR family DNA-binding protein [Bacteroidales bacterium]|nr:MmcQ/YjbR family DNA-binding protein [Bacteroidales bacterium]
MNIEEIREYCLSKKKVTESFPFDETTLVFKVLDKMFVLLDLEDLQLGLKCDPEKVVELRSKYDFVIPGYHMNKLYWNTIVLDEDISSLLLKEWIDHSYDEVVKKLPVVKRSELG